MRECTFKPNIPSYPPPPSTTSFSTSPGGEEEDGQVRQEPIIIRGKHTYILYYILYTLLHICNRNIPKPIIYSCIYTHIIYILMYSL